MDNPVTSYKDIRKGIPQSYKIGLKKNDLNLIKNIFIRNNQFRMFINLWYLYQNLNTIEY